MCRRVKASRAGAICSKLNFSVEFEEYRASVIEAARDLDCVGKSIVLHNLLEYTRRPARKAVRYIVDVTICEIELKFE